MSKKLVIIGASGHGKVVADIAKKTGYHEIVFLDDNENIHECGGYPVVGRSHEVETINADVIVGIGNAKEYRNPFRKERWLRLFILVLLLLKMQS